MWRDGTVYGPELVGRASTIGKTREAQSSHEQAVAIARATRKAKRYLRGTAATNVEVSA
jgi:hypothetical protein